MSRNRKWVEAVWRSILRGPRGSKRSPVSPAEVSQSSTEVRQGQGSTKVSAVFPKSVGTPPPSRHASKVPEKVAADAVGEIEMLQAAIAALGDSPTFVRHEALRAAQARASVPQIRASSHWNVPRNACSARRRSSTELARRKFCTRQRSSRAKRGLPSSRPRRQLPRPPLLCHHKSQPLRSRFQPTHPVPFPMPWILQGGRANAIASCAMQSSLGIHLVAKIGGLVGHQCFPHLDAISPI